MQQSDWLSYLKVSKLWRQNNREHKVAFSLHVWGVCFAIYKYFDEIGKCVTDELRTIKIELLDPKYTTAHISLVM